MTTDMDDVFKALADPNRRHLLDRLNQRNGQTLRELCAGLAMTRQSVSKHLAILEGANLVSTKPRGREKLHFLNPVPINAIAERWMTQFDRDRTIALADLKHTLEHQPMDNAFVYTTYIKTTPEQLWTALTDPAFTKRYWGVELISDWNVGSPIVWRLDKVSIDGDNQVVLAADPPKKLSYTWHQVTQEFMDHYGMDDQEFFEKANAERRTRVTFDIEPMGDMVKLTVTHDDADEGSVILEGVSQGWPSIISSLKTLLETGEPLTTDVN